MTYPNCKILVYNTADALVYTLTSDIEEAHVNLSLTSSIGTFSFKLPGKKTHSYVYNDIGNNYKVKIYMGYGTLADADLQMVGRILKYESIMEEGRGGFWRVFSGKDQGEILERRLKVNRRYEEVDASTIVTVDIATELGIYDAAKIAADTTTETITIRTEPYLEYLKKVSDYWKDGATKVQKDFYVDNDNELVWKARPIRTAGVETLTVGGNILNSRVIYDILPVKNSIVVYGAAGSFYPIDKDAFTEALSGTINGVAWSWAAAIGALSLDNATPKEGTYNIRCLNSSADYECDVTLTLPRVVNLRDINKLSFWYICIGPDPIIQLLAPDTSNYFEAALTMNGAWQWFSQTLGDSNIYDADENPSGVWTETGNPNWWAIKGIRFYSGTDTSTRGIYVDKLYFNPDRWYSSASNGTSQTNYALREAEFTDDNLLSSAECQKRAETLILQVGDRLLAAELGLVGNTNVKIGDRIPLTLPQDNISAVNFDVVQVSHLYKKVKKGAVLRTDANFIYAANTRLFPPRTPADALQRNVEHLRAVTSELYSRVVR